MNFDHTVTHAFNAAQHVPQLKDWLHGALRLRFNVLGGETAIKPGFHKSLLTFTRRW